METGWAKINLTLEILGKRPDGYHELSSLVVFAALGDRLHLTPGSGFSLEVTGPYADAIEGENLIEKVARTLKERHGAKNIGSVLLEKLLPVASGVGGGSADAGAFLRLYQRFSGVSFSQADVQGFGRIFGADVPVCTWSRPVLMGGIGEEMAPLCSLPDMALLLVNPGVAVSTRAVFDELGAPLLDQAQSPPSLKAPVFSDFEDVVAYMQGHGNDLTVPAMGLAPVIGDVLGALSGLPGCALARLSGSGATCFGVFPGLEMAAQAALTLKKMQPAWWLAPAAVRPVGSF